jgi:hypothetical protein
MSQSGKQWVKVATVDADKRLAKVDRDSVGEARGEAQHATLASGTS